MNWDDDLEGIEGKSVPHVPEVTQFAEGNGEVSPDVLSVWGQDPGALAHAQMWIRAWGVEVFRESKLHKMALMEQERSKELSTVRQTWMKKEKKEKK